MNHLFTIFHLGFENRETGTGGLVGDERQEGVMGEDEEGVKGSSDVGTKKEITSPMKRSRRG